MYRKLVTVVGSWEWGTAWRIGIQERLTFPRVPFEPFFFFFFWPCHTACGILVPQPGIKPVPPALEAQSSNHWTAREFPPFEPFKFCTCACITYSQNKIQTKKEIEYA